MVSVPCSLLLSIALLSAISPLSSSFISIPLSHSYTNQNPSQDHLQKLNYLVSTSLARAHHLKNPQTTPVFSHSYGGYSISLSFGTPPQTLSFVMDTGSSFVWFPCTLRYLCNNCSFTSRISPFLPKHSSSSKIIGCKNPKCSWIHQTDLRCTDCDNNSRNCSQICPPYLILYGSGTTGGVALSETLHLHGLIVPNFLVGCSVFSSRQPAGIAGFGRGPSSLPSQLGLTKFSYCLLSHKFDDTQESSSLVLDSQSDSDKKTAALMYTPLVKNPKVQDKPAFSVYYYVSLRRISIGGRSVKIPYKYLSPDKDGNGGTIIDSGTTFTYMSTEAFEILSNEFISQVKNYERALMVEALSGLKPCFNVSGAKELELPQLRLHFKGGADVELPLENYFAFLGSREVACFTVVTDGAEKASGPGMILGNFQMQNFYVEYDLQNERLGFKKESCK
ncbi:probable aspartyl protease At4g16563 [Ricinus communis]|uniref:Aspartic proteinase nepenthesin-2, putative n=1 Tax=Ricinus communis TaxID=3988 RepID=B9SD00_RICCO|nr:probable aspartyl protease At4g16563 [Ricinus communis]XP_048233695.1 probable aspartyl protease At4g16563 [Ricinus communis]XP_048233696.1 probable aspartyl protease At4g16563 [Ricinus communis]EEF38595.1 Aspartic proteinase nepenthesin-2 precursor, putative [Ricinus communis]|eukprot:XP_025013963.1 probable aspartyl protease At4g16563 [Ricinus communis]